MNIRVKNLVSEITIKDLQEIFGKYGKVTSISLTSDTGASFGNRHIAFIEMPDEKEGMAAIKGLDGTKINNQIVNLAETVKK